MTEIVLVAGQLGLDARHLSRRCSRRSVYGVNTGFGKHAPLTSPDLAEDGRFHPDFETADALIRSGAIVATAGLLLSGVAA